jgi:hypothetical protein
MIFVICCLILILLANVGAQLQQIAVCFSNNDCPVVQLRPCELNVCNILTKSCESRPKDAGTICQPETACSLAASCNGNEFYCPPLVNKPPGTPCTRGGDGPCSDRKCVAGDCLDGFKLAGTPCASVNDTIVGKPCFGVPQCSGLSDRCPAPVARTGEPCGPQPLPSEPCRASNRCTNNGDCVEVDPLRGVVCRAAVDECDVAEVCTGLSYDCSVDLRNQTCIDLRTRTTSATKLTIAMSTTTTTTTPDSTVPVQSLTSITSRLTLPHVDESTGALSDSDSAINSTVGAVSDAADQVTPGSLGTPAIAGIAAGSAALLLIVVMVAVLVSRGRRRKSTEATDSDRDGVAMRPPMISASTPSQYDSVRSVESSARYGSAPRATDVYEPAYAVGNIDPVC